MHKPSLVVITPIFPPSTGGAATYYGLLIKRLLLSESVDKVTVITEHLPSEQVISKEYSGRCEIIRIFPYRASATMSLAKQYFKYALQNALYLYAWYLIKKKSPDIILVHSSFHNHINLFHLIAKYLLRDERLIADVRDHQMPVKNLYQLNVYSDIIACSENIIQYLSSNFDGSDKIKYIPVLQEKIKLNPDDIVSALKKFDLYNVNYIMYAGLIKKDKGVQLLIESFVKLKLLGYEGKLVLAGVVKESDLLASALKNNDVIYVGPLQHDELMLILSSARMLINLSSSEGLPRICLEAMELNVPVLLPKGIPEFGKHCPENVANSSDPTSIASQIMFIINNNKHQTYIIKKHHEENVIGKYIKLMRGSCSV